MNNSLSKRGNIEHRTSNTELSMPAQTHALLDSTFNVQRSTFDVSPNPQSKIRNRQFRTPHSALRTSLAFTLIEMLVVIAIIGILAGLIISGAGIATNKSRIARVQTERDALITAIESYQKAKGFYPPDNTNDTVQNLLFYELTGTVEVASGTPPVPTGFKSGITAEQLMPANLLNYFNVGSLLNASSDPTAIRNFYPGLKAGQHQLVKSFNPVGTTFTVIGVPVSGPSQLTAAPTGPGSTSVAIINPWHYNVSHPTNNPDSFDLWMDVTLKAATNRISNWSKDPQPL